MILLHSNAFCSWYGLFALLNNNIVSSPLNNLQVIPKSSKSHRKISKQDCVDTSQGVTEETEQEVSTNFPKKYASVLTSQNRRLNIYSFTKDNFLLILPTLRQTLLDEWQPHQARRSHWITICIKSHVYKDNFRTSPFLALDGYISFKKSGLISLKVILTKYCISIFLCVGTTCGFLTEHFIQIWENLFWLLQCCCLSSMYDDSFKSNFRKAFTNSQRPTALASQYMGSSVKLTVVLHGRSQQ